MPRCAWGLCNSDSRYGSNGKRPRPDMTGVKFFPFPKPKSNLERCKAWIKACGRKDFSIANINKNTYVCSKHFEQHKPTTAFPDPNEAITVGNSEIPVKAKRKPPTKRSCVVPAKRKVLDTQKDFNQEPTHSAEAVEMIDESTYDIAVLVSYGLITKLSLSLVYEAV